MERAHATVAAKAILQKVKKDLNREFSQKKDLFMKRIKECQAAVSSDMNVSSSFSTINPNDS